MSAPVDVLAVMDRDAADADAHRLHLTVEPIDKADIPSTRRSESDEARAAVAELIAADKEYDNALVNVTTINREISERGWVALEYDALSQACTRLARAESRRMAAIAAVSP